MGARIFATQSAGSPSFALLKSFSRNLPPALAEPFNRGVYLSNSPLVNCPKFHSPPFLAAIIKLYQTLSNRIKVNQSEPVKKIQENPTLSKCIAPNPSVSNQGGVPAVDPDPANSAPPRPATLFPPLRTHSSHETELANDTFELPCRPKRTSIPAMSPLRHHQNQLRTVLSETNNNLFIAWRSK